MKRDSDTAYGVIRVLSLGRASALAFAVEVVVGERDVLGGSARRGRKRKIREGSNLGLSAWGEAVEAFTRRENGILSWKPFETSSSMDLYA